MGNPIQQAVDLVVRLFALGLFITILLNWIHPPALSKIQHALNRFYDIFLNPLRRHIPPLRLSSATPVGIDLTPIILLLIVLLIHRFLMWVFR